MKTRALVVAAVVLGVVGGCRNRIQSTLTVNGAPFAPTRCNSGVPMGFTGVELANAAGARLRLVATPSGQTAVYLFQPGAASGYMGVCGTLSLQQQSSQINSVYNVRGNASLNCSGFGGMVAGTVEFENCH